ncbi:MAG: hypothetical protein JF615_00310 [Asticcacaulis sp.]|nr:hypothetical protein [Asticcacaulis sp.]
MTGYHLRAAIYFLLLVGCLIGSLSGGARLLFSFAFFVIAVSQLLFLCPRCGKHIDTKGEDEGGFFYLPGERHAETCPCCNRSRKDVWMMQYFLKREDWDGQRYDDR